MKKFASLYLFLALLTMGSCASDKYNNISPITQSIQNSQNSSQRSIEKIYGGNIQDNLNASEITNIVSTFPRTQNSELNKEISQLKLNLQNYLYAYEAVNIQGKNRYLKLIQKSYKRIQKLKEGLNADENHLVNRYLVRIKTNISELEYNLAKP